MANSEQNDRRSGNAFLPFLMGVGVMALVGTIFYLLTQRPANSPQVAASPPSSPAAVEAPPTSSQPAPFVSDGSLPPAQTLNLQVNHANGSTARLTQLAFADDSITADLAITNGMKKDIRLNNSNDMLIRDNLGNIYNLAAPPNNGDIRITAGTTLKGKFVFKGRLAPNVTSLDIVTNDKFGGDQSYSSSPKMTFAVPVSGGAK